MTDGGFPLVVQLGRWRRQVTVPAVGACTVTAVPRTLTRLPRNKAEGDIPLMAVSTGSADRIECVLRKMGIADSEFTIPTAAGRIHMYRGDSSPGATSVGGSPFPQASTLYGSSAALAKYDLVLFACEGGEYLKAAADQNRVINYADVGGRVFNTHFSYVWMFDIAPWMNTAAWSAQQPYPPNPTTGYVNTGFAKGAAFSNWLSLVGAANPDAGMFQIAQGRRDVNGVNAPTANWVNLSPPDAGQNRTMHLTFNTPTTAAPEDQCGRVVFSDFHVNTTGGTGSVFPTRCGAASPLTAQEKVLEYMLFDLSSCIVPDVWVPTCTRKTCASYPGVNCGQQADGCGGLTASCGTCTVSGETCGGSGVPGQCGSPTCVPKNCSQLGFLCGQAGDGCGNVIDCGTCTVAGETCGGGGTPGVCGKPICTPNTCAGLGFNCGPAGDGCGGLLDCGTCAPNSVCGGDGFPGVCSLGID